MRQYQVKRAGVGVFKMACKMGAWIESLYSLQRDGWSAGRRKEALLRKKNSLNPSWQAFCMQLNRQMYSAARILPESYLMSVTQKIPGHWWSDKPLCLRATVLKLEHASESPGGLVKTQATGILLQSFWFKRSEWVRVGLLLLAWGSLLKNCSLRMIRVEVLAAQSCPTLCNPWTAACRAPPSVGFSRQENWSGSHSLLQVSLWPQDWTRVSHIAGRFFTFWASREARVGEPGNKDNVY